MGAALGCGGHLTGLVRTRSGGFSLAAATTLADLEHHAARCTWHSLLVAPTAALAHLPALTVTPQGGTLLRQGQPVSSAHLLSSVPAATRTTDPVCALDAAGRLIAIVAYDPQQDCWRPRKVVG